MGKGTFENDTRLSRHRHTHMYLGGCVRGVWCVWSAWCVGCCNSPRPPLRSCSRFVVTKTCGSEPSTSTAKRDVKIDLCISKKKKIDTKRDVERKYPKENCAAKLFLTSKETSKETFIYRIETHAYPGKTNTSLKKMCTALCA